MAKKTEIEMTREDIKDLVRTKHLLLQRRAVRRAINEEMAEVLAAFDAKVLQGALSAAPDVKTING